MSETAAMLHGLLAVRGVKAAALVGVDGEYLSGESPDAGLLERMVGTVTTALAAGEALAGLLAEPQGTLAATGAGEKDEADAVTGRDDVSTAEPAEPRRHQLMVVYQDGGPILFTPLPGGERVAVVALSSSHDIGRARFQLRALRDAPQ